MSKMMKLTKLAKHHRENRMYKSVKSYIRFQHVFTSNFGSQNNIVFFLDLCTFLNVLLWNVLLPAATALYHHVLILLVHHIVGRVNVQNTNRTKSGWDTAGGRR